VTGPGARIAFVALGGALGALTRYGLSHAANQAVHQSFPAGTLAVNVAGCLCIGFLGHAFTHLVHVPRAVQVGVLVGFLGGLTTFSSYGYDTLLLAEAGARWKAVANILLNNALGLAAVFAGWWAALRVYGHEV
jgi:CrcB protein